jgi:pimeloyl-ACP methyl ester carboxylesterase
MTPAVIDRYWELLRYPGNRVATIARFAQGYSPLTAADLARITAPTLILWGRDDRFIPVAAAGYFAKTLPHSRTVIYDGVGHIPMEEAPDRSAADVAAFMATLTATRSSSAPNSAPSPSAQGRSN